jgi:arylsulfatase A-like enzyme
MSTDQGGNIFGRNDRLKFKDPTIAEEFRKLGYKTAQIGKWHIDTRPSLVGFDESLVTTGNIFTNGRFSKNEDTPYPIPGFTPDHEISMAKEYSSFTTILFHRICPYLTYPTSIHICTTLKRCH